MRTAKALQGRGIVAVYQEAELGSRGLGVVAESPVPSRHRRSLVWIGTAPKYTLGLIIVPYHEVKTGLNLI